MGMYVNPKSYNFIESIRSEPYIDKTELIIPLNKILGTRRKYVCVSRPRRFGKSMAVDMLAAYYGCDEDTDVLFQPFKASEHSSYYEHLNNYHVIQINMQNFLSVSRSIEEMIQLLQKRVTAELEKLCPIPEEEAEQIDWVMQEVFRTTGKQFVILIDEWDCLFRLYKEDFESQRKYLDFLRLWLKDQPYIALAYMTGILPIKKYGTHSALNMFYEYSMSDPGEMAPFFGFTEDEVRELCQEYDMDFEKAKDWYDGYTMRVSGRTPTISIYSPKSVVESLVRGMFGTYWNQTESYEALMVYLKLNYDGLQEAVISMLAGEKVKINTSKFQNDMTVFSSKDDVLTLLVHLGYLTYDSDSSSVSIPNKEVRLEWMNAVTSIENFNGIAGAITDSGKLLQSLWNQDEERVAIGIDKAHQEVALLQYNDENALSYTISLAFYAAREYYTMIRELPSGKGFADVCFLPKKQHADKPALLIELKWDKSADTAITQIKEKGYEGALADYRDNLLLAGINYNKDTKKHECRIERFRTQNLKK